MIGCLLTKLQLRATENAGALYVARLYQREASQSIAFKVDHNAYDIIECNRASKQQLFCTSLCNSIILDEYFFHRTDKGLCDKDNFDVLKCNRWVGQGECMKNSDWMWKNCCKSCQSKQEFKADDRLH